jgi:hypothetical protein
VKRLTLKAAQVLATSDLVPGDDLSLKIYCRVFRDGPGDCLPPIIVGTIKSASEWIGRLEQGYSQWEKSKPDMVQRRRREYRILFQKLRTTPHYILDGNHRALAAALNRRDLKVLEVDSDGDLLEIERMVRSGDLFSFPHKAQSVDALEGLFIEHSLNLNDIPPNHGLLSSRNLRVERLVTVATRTYELCSHNLLPSYLVKHYSQRKDFHRSIKPV